MRYAGAILAGLLAGLVTTAIALLLTGAGHGWGGGMPSCWSLIGAPVGFLSLAIRSREDRRLTAMIAVASGGLMDLMLIGSAFGDSEYFLRTLHAAGPAVVLWGALLTSWQLAGLVVLLRDDATSRIPESSDRGI